MKIKRAKWGLSLFTCLILALVLFSAGIGIAAAADPIVSIIPSQSTVCIGDDFDVFVHVNPNGNILQMAQVDLTFDSSLVSLTHENGGVFDTFIAGTQSGDMVTDITGLDSGVSTTGNLAVLHMHAESAGEFALGLSGATAGTATETLTPTVNDGTVTINVCDGNDPIVSIKPAVKEVNVSDDFSIFIEVDPNGNTVETALLNLTYDPNKVSITDVVMNGVDFPANYHDDTTIAGQITSIMGLSFTGLTTAANLAEIQMHANAAGTFTVGISGNLTKPPGDPLTPVTMNTGEVRIKIPGEPLDVTVLHPNGGESIPIGTQVQVSAHATDDTAVTSVTFSYSNNSGSDWNTIGAGTRVSGTDKDGIWNRTWNTNNLGAGSNYLIRAVASDGTSTREDRSDSTFSLTCTPPSVPTLNDPGTTDTDGNYTVAWSSVSGATSYTLEEDTSGSFGSPAVVYSGSGTSKYITGRSDGTYYYRVNACNACGCGGWSNMEDIEVSMDVGGWNKTFGGTDNDVAYSVQQTSDGGFILGGYTDSYGAGSSDFWLVKTDSSGNKQWDKTFGATESDIARSVQETSDGGYILAGCTRSYGAGSYDAWLVRINSNGDILWHAALGGTGWDMAESVQQTSDGGFILAGYTGSYGDVFYDAWLVKVDCNGCVQWNTTFGGFGRDVTESVSQTSDGGYIIAGSTPPQGSYLFAAGFMNPLDVDFADAWLVKIDSNGNKQWDQTFGGADWDTAESVQQTSDGGFILAGYTKSYGAGDPDFWLIKTDSDGGKEWDKTFGGTDDDYAYSVRQTFDGGYILAGVTEPPSDPTPVILAGFMGPCSAGGSDVWLIKTDSGGGKEWDETFGGTGDDYASSVQETSDGGYVVAGCTKSYGAGGSDFWLAKVGGEGASTIVWQGDVTLINGSIFNKIAHNSNESYNIYRTTALGALDAAAEKGGFKYTVNDEWYASCGCLVVDSIADIRNNGLDRWVCWVNYPDDPMPMVGANLCELENGDVVTFYRSSSMDITPMDSSEILAIDVTITPKTFYGDLNHDGILTPADAAIALQLAASGGWDSAADVDGDRRITSLDALMILQAAAGTISL